MRAKNLAWLNLTNISSSMTDSPLYVAFLWHMHQPFYKDPFSGDYRLPWVRLHGTKDYLDMADILDEYPDIKQTFNLVPSLIEQIIDYTDNNASDVFLDITIKKASDLSDADRVFMLENFFLANWDTMIKPFPRYYELLLKRGLRVSRSDLHRTIRYFTENDFLDIQVLFNLAWIDPMFRTKDPFLDYLVKKGKGFSEEDKKILIEKQLSILKEIIPKYRRLSEKGQIEISTTPFYHPILPLLWDTDTAKLSSHNIRLPKRRFSHPEDAQHQIRSAINYFEKIFGYRPAGMWPSEGSVSKEVLGAISAEGLQWVASDEDILSCSLGISLRGSAGNVIDPSILYTAYNFSGISIVFRDRILSDLIGFTYSGWDPKVAADDLIARLVHIRSLLHDNEPHIVSIILDGENAWEYYRNDGQDFLRYLYEGLSGEKRIKTTTISGYLRENNIRKTLKHIHAGSWINANFNIWIGHAEDNTAWDYLTETRDTIESFRGLNTDKSMDDALKALYVAEGSDWNWWYGDEHSTENAKDFDELFRFNLMKAYKEMGKDVPPNLFVPIIMEDRAAAPSMQIKGFIYPKIDGIMTGYFEWYQAAYMDVGRTGGSMHMSESHVFRIYYGFNRENLFIRIDPKVSFSDFPENTVFCIDIVKPSFFRAQIPLRNAVESRLLSKKGEEWVDIKKMTDVAIGDILECAIPFSDITAREKDELNIVVSIRKDSEEVERCPWRGFITVTVPTPDFEAMMWF